MMMMMLLQTTFSSQQGVSVAFDIAVSNLMYEVIPLAQTPIQLLAQIGSLIGTGKP